MKRGKRGKRNGISVDFIQNRYVCVRKTDMDISHLHNSLENAFGNAFVLNFLIKPAVLFYFVCLFVFWGFWGFFCIRENIN